MGRLLRSLYIDISSFPVPTVLGEHFAFQYSLNCNISEITLLVFFPYSSLPNCLQLPFLNLLLQHYGNQMKKKAKTSNTRHSECVLWTKPLSHNKCQKCKEIINCHPRPVYFFLNKNRITIFNSIRNIFKRIRNIQQMGNKMLIFSPPSSPVYQKCLHLFQVNAAFLHLFKVWKQEM